MTPGCIGKGVATVVFGAIEKFMKRRPKSRSTVGSRAIRGWMMMNPISSIGSWSGTWAW